MSKIKTVTHNGQVACPTYEPNRMAAMFNNTQTTEHKGVTIVWVPHNLENALELQRMGYDAPSPMALDYSWPGPFTPYEHQRKAAEFMSLQPRAFNLSGMGTGKTAATLWAADYLMEQGEVNKALIITPLSTMERVWGDEMFNLMPHRTYTILHHSTSNKRVEMLDEDTDFYVVNHDGIKITKLFEKLHDRKDIDLVIVDECAAFRNRRTERWKRLKMLSDPPRRLWMLTGTPTPNAPTDAFGQVKLVAPERVPNSFQRFQDATMQKVNMYKYTPREGAEAVVFEAMQPAIRFKKEDCLDLPPVSFLNRQAELTKEQKQAAKSMKDDYVASVSGEEITAANAAVQLSKLLQIQQGILKSENEIYKLDNNPRMNTLLECIEAAEAKVIVFASFKAVCEVVRDAVSEHFSCELVYGDTSQSERDRIYSQFQNSDDPRVLIAHPQTTAHGLTLTAAADTIWFGPTFSAEQYEQANNRMNRPGQKLNMNVIHIGATNLEWMIFERLKAKQSLQAEVLDLYHIEFG